MSDFFSTAIRTVQNTADKVVGAVVCSSVLSPIQAPFQAFWTTHKGTLDKVVAAGSLGNFVGAPVNMVLDPLYLIAGTFGTCSISGPTRDRLCIAQREHELIASAAGVATVGLGVIPPLAPAATAAAAFAALFGATSIALRAVCEERIPSPAEVLSIGEKLVAASAKLSSAGVTPEDMAKMLGVGGDAIAKGKTAAGIADAMLVAFGAKAGPAPSSTPSRIAPQTLTSSKVSTLSGLTAVKSPTRATIAPPPSSGGGSGGFLLGGGLLLALLVLAGGRR